ncbi:MAG: S-adenosylmethionine:tRNA ribosyltransferase-isomerase [Myxococcota bacterium]
MSPAAWPRTEKLDEKLLHIDPRRETFTDLTVRNFASLLREGDLLVVNDAATLPGSLRGKTAGGLPVEVRLLAHDVGSWTAVLFGPGDWRTPTEHRPPPPTLRPGEIIMFSDGLTASVWSVSTISRRLVVLRFNREGAALWSALYGQGAPVQYAYMKGPLDLWLVQNGYGARPWAVELPSAGRPLKWELLLDLTRKGVRMARLTHGAGLSSTGDPELDAALPLPERYDIPAETVRLVEETREGGARVVAVGTSVVRALEGNVATHGRLTAGEGVTDVLLGPGYRPRVVHGLLTGMHEPTGSHFALLAAFAPPALIQRAYRRAEELGYLCHEFGDSNLILAS